MPASRHSRFAPELNRKTTYRDVRNLIREIKEENPPKQPEIWTRYAYDAVQQLRGVQDHLGNVTTVDYDQLGRRTLIDNPDTGPTVYRYDPASNLRRKITANLAARGQAIVYSYDINRLIAIDYPNHDETDVTYQYGPSSSRGDGKNQVGRIARVDDESGHEIREYGRLGEVVKETKTIDSDTLGRSDNSPEIYTTTYLYDTWGRLQEMT